jgi:protein-disulfide isomerase
MLDRDGDARRLRRGPAGAGRTVVEFSDFQCPFCSKVEPTIKRVMTEAKVAANGLATIPGFS